MLVWWAQSHGHRPGRRVYPLGWPEQWLLNAEAVSAMQCSDSALVSLQGEKRHLIFHSSGLREQGLEKKERDTLFPSLLNPQLSKLPQVIAEVVLDFIGTSLSSLC